jgi:signal transduction histidine kinase
VSTGSTTLPENGSPDAAASRRRLPRLRDARIRSKLALILVVPIAAVLALATVRIIDVGSRAYDANQVQSLTSLSATVSDLTQYLHKERMVGARYLASPTAVPNAYNAQVAATDLRINTYRAARGDLDELPAAVQAQLQRIDNHLQTMDATRTEVLDRTQMDVSEAVLRYGVIITDLVAYGEVLGQFAGDGPVADGLRAVSAFARAKAGTAEQEAVAFAARTSGDSSDEASSAFVATQTSQQEALLSFFLSANPAQRTLVDSTVTGDAVLLADQVSTALTRSRDTGSDVTANEAASAIGAVVDLMRWAELRLEGQLLDDAAAASSSVARQAAIEAILVLLTLIVAVVLTIVLARSLSSSLRRLREGALAVANRDLPDAVARLRDVRNLGDGGAGDIVRQVRDPIQLNSRDEIGQVAQAFNVVHKEAVRIAAEQAALRTSVSAMFLNLARRSQSLVDRMIGELDQIERGEEDPKRLAQLFELDHLATRMRRNDENLLVLAGADSSAPRREDALLVDALRAAQSEVELYNRIEFGTIDTDISITALAVNDVVRLIAELLDNATRFSPPNTVVVADGRRIRDYVVVQVEDRGLGMSEDQMAGLNRRLAQPPGVDVAAFRLMGLAVVGRLASRYGIRVELRANIEGGTVAQIVLPSTIVVLPNRPIEPVRQQRPQPVDSGPTRGSWGEPISAARAGSATATLPAIAPEPWQNRSDPSEDRLIRAANNASAAQALAPPAHSPQALPASPSTPALPGRSAQPQSAQPQFAAPTVQAPPARPVVVPPVTPPASFEQPDAAPFGQPDAAEPAVEENRAPATASRPPLPIRSPSSALTAPTAPSDMFGSALGSPTVAYPTLQAAPVVGFVNPDGTTVSSSTRPVSPNTSGWGAALAAMPSPPPPPAPAPVQDRADSPIFQEMQVRWFQGHDGADPEEWSMPTAGYAPPPNPVPGGGAVGAPTGPLGGTPSPGPAGPGARPDGAPAAAPASPAPASPAPVASAAAPSAPASPAAAARPAPPAEEAAPAATRPAAPVSPAPDTSVGTGSQPTVPRPRKSPEGGWRTAADEGWHRAMAAAEPDSAGTTRSGLPKRVPQAQLVPGGVQTAAAQRDQTRRTPDEVRGLLSAYHRGVQRGRTAGSAEAAGSDLAPKENEQ